MDFKVYVLLQAPARTEQLLATFSNLIDAEQYRASKRTGYGGIPLLVVRGELLSTVYGSR